MSNFDYLSYKGNAIFRDQPNHSYFDKPFDDEQDCLFQALHEIDSHFLKPEQKAQTLNINSETVIDPRTQKPINQLCYDHTQEEATQKFHSPKRSMMTEKQHELGVKVLNALQQCLEVEEEDMFNWYRLQKIRVNEKEYFQRYVFELSQGNKEQMYAPCRKLLELYQKWYKQKVFKLMKRYPPESYNTHLGLPQVRQCKNVLSDQQVEIIQPEIVTKLGAECRWQDDTKQEIKKFTYSIGSYAEIYINSEDLKETLEDKLKTQFEKLLEDEIEENAVFYMPLESLLFMVAAGDYVDIPTEMLLNIRESENGEGVTKRYIIMEQPLPSRQAGWHTYQQVVEQAIKGMLSVKQLDTQEEDNLPTMEGRDNSTEYRVSTIEDFMQKSPPIANKLCKFSKTLIKWQLGTLEDIAPFKIFTSLESFAENKDFSIKLEFKPKFGCEIFTKYDLLKEWFKLKLLQKSGTNCLRLDTTNYQTLLEESLSIRKLEEYLSVYHISCQQLLNNLYEFLKMLYNMPLGHYMLRYNPKFKDKLMLCKPSQEITQNTIKLYQLLQTDVTDLQFMTDQSFLLIDENLCSLMHLQHRILPAAFCPRTQPKKNISSGKGYVPKQKTIVKQPAKEPKKPIKNKTQMKRARRRQRMFAEIKAKKDEMKELRQEMELDHKMLDM
ncbi:little elongation complex subunit 2 [Lucilia sericata]|uniref:little elongation complex subunit 2 n=1 Tax=Lucilia sericata TaxID=13632 RepID=UPI0018A7F290|nr:little elongation complex subunit 2 [Lucilia sericata]